MSNYTKNTNFTAKDNLTSGDPAKVIKGAEFDTEFNSIQTAVNSKADSNNSQLTGSTAAQAITTTGDVTVGGNLAVTGNATISGNLTFGDADTDTVSFSADVNSNIIPDADATYDLGSPTKEWRNLYVDGTANIDSLVADTADINGGTIDGVSITGTTASFSGEISANGGIALGDNDKATFGASDDLQIYHNGSNSFIQDAGVGDLYITTNGSKIDITTNGLAEYGMRILQDSYVSLYHDNSAKLATTSTGVDVTGTVTADGLTVDGIIASSSGTPVVRLNETDTTDQNGQIRVAGGYTWIETINDAGTVNTKRIAIQNSTGDVSFYEDTGTTAKFVWDSSAEKLDLNGTTTVLNVKSPTQSIAGGNSQIKIGSTDTAAANKGGQLNFTANTVSLANYPVAGVHGYHETAGVGNYSGYLSMYTTSSGGGITERMRIDSSGNVGIGTASPSLPLDVHGGTIGVTSSTAFAGLQITSANNSFAYVNFGDSDDGNIGQIQYDHSSNAMNIKTNNAERARIDSSGNLLVGTTSPQNAKFKVGSGAYYNYVHGSADSVEAWIGSENLGAGTESSLVIGRGHYGGSGNESASLKLIPSHGNEGWNSGFSISSDRVNSGTAHAELNFKRALRGTSSTLDDTTVAKLNVNGNLWLNDGINLGGTGSANKLDDYEEGVWTPTYGGNAMTTVNDARYTKIGRIVHIHCDFTTPSNTSTQSVYISLPFVRQSEFNGGGVIEYTTNSSANVVTIGMNGISFRDSIRGTILTFADAQASRYIFSMTYETSA